MIVRAMLSRAARRLSRSSNPVGRTADHWRMTTTSDGMS